MHVDVEAWSADSVQYDDKSTNFLRPGPSSFVHGCLKQADIIQSVYYRLESQAYD